MSECTDQKFDWFRTRTRTHISNKCFISLNSASLLTEPLRFVLIVVLHSLWLEISPEVTKPPLPPRYSNNRSVPRSNEVAADSSFHLCSVDNQSPEIRNGTQNGYCKSTHRCKTTCCEQISSNVGLHKANINVIQTDIAMWTILLTIQFCLSIDMHRLYFLVHSGLSD